MKRFQQAIVLVGTLCFSGCNSDHADSATSAVAEKSLALADELNHKKFDWPADYDIVDFEAKKSIQRQWKMSIRKN